MRLYVQALALVVLLSTGVKPQRLHPRCVSPDSRKISCGNYADAGITQHECEITRGCCFDQKTKFGAGLRLVPWCYKGKYEITNSTLSTSTSPTTDSENEDGNPYKLSMYAYLQMKKDDVPQSIINSLLADSIPNGEWLYALRDGRLDKNEMMQLMKGSAKMNLNPVLAQYLRGDDMKGIVFNQVAKTYGVDPTISQLMMTDKKNPLMNHLLSKATAKTQLDPMSSLVLSSMTSGELTKSNVNNFMIDQMFKHESRFSREAYKAFIAGKKNSALKWAFLAASEKTTPIRKHYPINEAMFAYMVDNHKKFPGKISPSIIFSLAMNESIAALGNEGKTFAELFGVGAFDYVCAAHDADWRISCEALEGRIYPSSLECINAGCCLHESSTPGGRPLCYENIFGNIGVGILEHIWDEDYIVQNVFGGQLPSLENFYPDGIPWIPSSEISSEYSVDRDPSQPSWFETLQIGNGGYMLPMPTALPVFKPSKFRPNFKWEPHGEATAFPNTVTELPDGMSGLVTSSQGLIDGKYVPDEPSGPIVQSLSLQVFQSCRGVLKEKRMKYSCLSNAVALSEGGEQQCLTMECCYDPDWSDLSVPACFRKASYGQCHTVPEGQRVDCGHPGITKDECVSNPRCCYDSTIDVTNAGSSAPWCFFKLQSFVTNEERCERVGHTDREPCLTSTFDFNYNGFMSEESCVSAGCCYEEVRVSFLMQALGQIAPPPCYKKKQIVIERTVAPPIVEPAPPAPALYCKDRSELDPRDRTECEADGFHTCVNVKGCCYMPEFFIPGPWCYERS
ncbi:unnamed protein product [Clavelina lepadiformis]|uniref:P-type domain-containing protein n=1 Tax=Clavelina lepadiformis TaxID=159417 RepID=A0ABP0GUG6_CLALP